MKLKGRLKLIADKVPLVDSICDIGTDHALIPIYLLKNRICRKAIAADIKKGPISAANENIREYNLESQIETRLGNGLEPVSVGETDVIIIAGIGGIVIAEILSEGLSKAKSAKALIIQPMTAIEVVREYLYDNGFEIYDEELSLEGEKVYNVIVARWTGNIEKVDEVFYHIGKRLIDKKDPLLSLYINKKIKKLDKIINGMRKSGENKLETERDLCRVRDKIVVILEELDKN